MKTQFTFCILIFLFLTSRGKDPLNVPGQITNHPEAGILPFNAPCNDCQEDLTKRTSTRREFYKKEKGGSKTIYVQQSLGAINYLDENGFWRTVDPILKNEGENIFSARQQPAPVVVDLKNKFTSITRSGIEFRFNKNIFLSYIDENGIETDLGKGNWERVSRTENYTETIILVENIYPGIDLRFSSSYGRVESSFILKDKLSYANGWLVMNQYIEIPQGFYAAIPDSKTSDEKHTGIIPINNNDGENYFNFKPAYTFDAVESFVEMQFTLKNDKLSYFVPVNWLNNPDTKYPVTLDPTVSATDTLPQASMTGSGYSAICDSDGCSYHINFSMPTYCEVTDISTYFSYVANLPCIRSDGGFDIKMTSSMGSCLTRTFRCLGNIQGACYFWPAPILNAVPPLSPCVPPPQCAPYNVDFELRFKRCNWLPQGGCDNTCIVNNSPWIITIIGTLIPSQDYATKLDCPGTCRTISPFMFSGAWPYTFNWLDSGLTTDSVIVCPDTTTTYQFIATDLCGTSDTGSVRVEVYESGTLEFSILPSDSVVPGTQIVLSADYISPNSTYSWTVACNPNDTMNGLQVNYTTPDFPDVCTATLTYDIITNTSACSVIVTDTFHTVCGLQPEVQLYSEGVICNLGVATFHAVPLEGGAPVFQWFLNGVLIAGADSASYYSSPSYNGDMLVVKIISSDTCAMGVATDTLIVHTVAHVNPIVSINFADDTLCMGDTALFTVSQFGSGISPSYQWFVNGVLSGTDSIFSSSTLIDGDSISVKLISSLSCALPTFDTDSRIINMSSPSVSTVSIFNSIDSICAGDLITFTLTANNGGLFPEFTWYLNGVSIDTGFSFETSLSTGDSVVVTMESSLTCATPHIASDTVALTILSSLAPQVVIHAVPDTICEGDAVLFFANAIDAGASPQYQWYFNGGFAAFDSILMVQSFSALDSVWILLISSTQCASPDSVSDTASVLVMPEVIPSVTIVASDDTVCVGDQVTLTTLDFGAGFAPTYQWSMNGLNIAGATSSSYTTQVGTTSSFEVNLISNYLCASPASAQSSVLIVVETCLGIPESASAVFNIHPNPATDEITIEFIRNDVSSKQISILDVLGRTLYEKKNVDDKKLSIDISGFSRDVYFVRVITGENEYLERVVVQ